MRKKVVVRGVDLDLNFMGSGCSERADLDLKFNICSLLCLAEPVALILHPPLGVLGCQTVYKQGYHT